MKLINTTVWKIASKIKSSVFGNVTKNALRRYYKNFERFSFVDCNCRDFVQFEASIMRLYHTIEKGLSYADYRAGFGKENIEKLVTSLEQYSKRGFNTSVFFYETAISCLNAYIQKNKEHGYENVSLEERVRKLPGGGNNYGGSVVVSAPKNPMSLTYEELVKTRKSIRHFSGTPVDISVLEEAIKLAQYTPSACNRQGWKTRIIADKEKIKKILANQNGNKGFGHEFDKLLIVTADLRAQQKNRELFQAFIDGGMYAQGILNSLFSKGIGSVPLSAALTAEQEKNIRKFVCINDAEVFILFIGVGNYPEGEFLTTRSERKPIEIEVVC